MDCEPKTCAWIFKNIGCPGRMTRKNWINLAGHAYIFFIILGLLSIFALIAGLFICAVFDISCMTWMVIPCTAGMLNCASSLVSLVLSFLYDGDEHLYPDL